VRLRKHCDYFLETMNGEGNHGKMLNFISQEMGREINTIGSKANDASMQKLVVMMKDELEKIKELTLNMLVGPMTADGKRKVLIISAPSGAGKSTLVSHLLKAGLPLIFSVSATSRKPRGNEVDGREYYFITAAEFRKRVKNGEFVEWQEVYKDHYYGTLRTGLSMQEKARSRCLTST
jgi:predicted GTPase